MLIPYCSFSIVTVTPITTGQPFLHIFNITILPIMSDISASKAYRSEYDKHGKGTFGAINKSRAALFSQAACFSQRAACFFLILIPIA